MWAVVLLGVVVIGALWAVLQLVGLVLPERFQWMGLGAILGIMIKEAWDKHYGPDKRGD